jgi:hypothetical protein
MSKHASFNCSKYEEQKIEVEEQEERKSRKKREEDR